MISFWEYLQGINGKCKYAAVAKAVATDISKFLRYAMLEATSPKWETITDHRKPMDYLQKWSRRATVVRKASCTSGLCQSHPEVHSVHDFSEEDTSFHMRCTKVEKRIQGWKMTLRK